jgi:hypothetical protein
MEAFNKRIEPLLVFFKEEIRYDILIEDPKDRPFFTKGQAELTRGFPYKEKDQDGLDELLTISDTEIVFWKNVNIDPYYMYIDNTIELVNHEYVEKNKKIMQSDYKATYRVSDEDAYEFDAEGDFMLLSID